MRIFKIIYAILFFLRLGLAASSGPALRVDLNAPQHSISPFIYGFNDYGVDAAGQAFIKEVKIPVVRWGGDATSRYNWKVDAVSSAADWYFENYPQDHDESRTLPDGSSFDLFVERNRANGAESIGTIPLMGWVVKDRERRWGFSVAKYGAQAKVDPYQTDAGNGVKPDGKTNFTGNDPHDTSMEVQPAFMLEWIQHLLRNYGAASQGGVSFYELDNEPDWWFGTHRDIHPNPATYDEVRDQGYLYGPAIKLGDPTAQIMGPVSSGWWSTLYMSADWVSGWNTYPWKWWANPVDRKAHGDLPFVEWYLQEMRRYEVEHGLRILDYLDIHGYITPPDIAFQPAGDAAKQALRLESTRGLWDPTYQVPDNDMIGDPTTHGYLYFIPRIREWIAQAYPGTKTAITEYNWGALDHINGALAQADILGIFGREQLDLATIWGPPKPQEPGAFAFRIYRNYDGAGSQFGDVSLSATSENQSLLSIYASRRSNDPVLTLVIINKSTSELESQISFSGFSPLGDARVYQYSGANLNAIARQADLPFQAEGLTTTFPASSLTLIEVAGLSGSSRNDYVQSAREWGASEAEQRRSQRR